MKIEQTKECERNTSKWKMLRLAFIETGAIVVAALLPALFSGMYNLIRQGDASFLCLALRSFFSHGDGIVLALSVLGAAFVNQLDIGGGKVDTWATLRNVVWFFLVVVYLLTVAGNLAVVSSDDRCNSPCVAVMLSGFSCLILLTSSWWRRHHAEDRMSEVNPFEAEDRGFVANFGAFLNK